MTTEAVSIKVRTKLAAESLMSLNTTGQGTYYRSAGEALGKAFEILANYGLDLEQSYLLNAGNDGRRSFSVYREGVEVATLLYCWYRMPSGSFETTTYLSAY